MKAGIGNCPFKYRFIAFSDLKISLLCVSVLDEKELKITKVDMKFS